MSLVSLPAVVIASITIYVGVLQLYVYYKRRQFREDLTFSLTCFAVGLYDICCVGLYSSVSTTQGAFWQRWQAFSLAWVGMAFAWFIYDYTGKMPKAVVVAFTGLFSLSAIMQAFVRNQITWIIDQPLIKVVGLPFGKITYYEVSPGLWTNIQSLLGLISGIYVLWIIVKYYREGNKPRAVPLLIAMVIFFIGVINDIAVSSGVYVSLYVIEFAYMGLVLLINYSMSRQVLESAQVKEALRISEERLSDALDAANDGLFDLNLKTGNAYLSSRWYTMLGYAPNELPAHYDTWKDLIHPDDTVYAEQVIQEYREKKRHNHELEIRMRSKSGEWKWILSRAKIAEYDRDGSPLRMLGTHVDTSDRKRVEEEIRKLNEELEARVRERTSQLETTNKELEAFTYSVSHNLRAPLRAVDGFSRILLEDYTSQLSKDITRYLSLIRENALQMGRLIDDLLAFSRFSRHPLTKVEVNQVNLVFEAIESLSSERQDRQFDITVGDLPPCQGDMHLLKQVWVNLLSNALKYTRTRQLVTIRIDHLLQDDQPVYYIRDNGIGFNMEYADKIFGVFQRLHRGDEYEGTGVGLAIVQRIITRHGGRIWVESAPDSGATFYFTL